ncbi:MAG TPA: Smr/MutS family protein [Gallionella sp.]|nr:Smr/MutS family protein [Gallionella sp.]
MKRSSNTPQATPDDAALFRAAVGEVHPLPQQNRIERHAPPRRPLLRNAAVPEIVPDTLSDFASGELPDEYLGNGLSRMMLRKLRRGHWPIQDSLDLHGLNTDAARQLLQVFLHGAKQRGLRCVLVIHGKGMAVLKQHTRHWLIQHPQVLAWCEAAPGDGGSGAVLALLRSGA